MMVATKKTLNFLIFHILLIVVFISCGTESGNANNSSIEQATTIEDVDAKAKAKACRESQPSPQLCTALAVARYVRCPQPVRDPAFCTSPRSQKRGARYDAPTAVLRAAHRARQAWRQPHTHKSPGRRQCNDL